MRLSSDNGRWMLKGVGGLSAAVLLAVACAGGDTPPRDAELLADIIERYDNAVGQAGSASMGGSGGGGGQGGSGQGGSVSNAGAGGSGTGAAGSSAAGSGSVGYCDGPAILVAKCGSGSGCHGTGSTQGAFGASPTAAATFVDTLSSRGAACGSFIDSASPDDSLILTMSTGDAGPNCSSLPMPLTGEALTPTEEDCLSDWLSQF